MTDNDQRVWTIPANGPTDMSIRRAQELVVNGREITGIRVTAKAQRGYLTYDSGIAEAELLMHPDDCPEGTCLVLGVPVRWDA